MAAGDGQRPMVRGGQIGYQRYWIRRLGKLLAEEANNMSLPAPGAVQGEVLRCFRHRTGSGLVLVDTDGSTLEVMCEGVADVKRGCMVRATGAPAIRKRQTPLGIGLVWSATELTDLGPSEQYLERQAAVSEVLAGLTCPPPQLGPHNRGGTVWVVTGHYSKAWGDVLAAKPPWITVGECLCNLLDPDSVAEELQGLSEVLEAQDVVLLTRGGGDPAHLSVLESAPVIRALGELTARNSTVLAVGHASDDLLTSQVVSHTSTTPTAGMNLIARETRWRRRNAAQEGSGEPTAADPTPRTAAPNAMAPESVPITPARADWRPWQLAILLAVAASSGWWLRGFFD